MSSTAPWKAKSHRSEYDRMRLRLIDAAWDFASENGFNRLTLNAVAARAEVARSSVYRYFDNKEQLLGAVLQEQILRFGQGLRKELHKWSDPSEQIVRGLHLAVIEIRNSPTMELLQTTLGSREEKIADILLDYVPREAPSLLSIDPIFSDAREAGLVREDVSDEDVVRWMVLVGIALAQTSLLGEGEESELEFLRRMLLPAIFVSS